MGDLFHGGHKTARTFDNMVACAKSLDTDQKKTVETLRDIGISHRSMHTMLHLDLKLKKCCAKLIPHDLKTETPKQTPVVS